jgi:predicted nucleotidyltransferase component of viral defense system
MLGIQKIDVQQSFNRNLVFIHFRDEILKTEFTYYPFPQLESPRLVSNLHVDSLRDIAVNKIFTIYQRPQSRDFIDLYLIMTQQHWELKDLRASARVKFDSPIDPLQLAQQLLEAATIADLPHMLHPLPGKTWRSFWLEQAKALKSDVLKP